MKMRRTTVPLLLTLATLAGAIGWLGQIALASAGQSPIVPPLTLTVALVGLAVIVVSVGWPIRQALRSTTAPPIDPFRATRILMLAKASSFTGALFTGAAVGSLLHLVLRDVPPPTSPTLDGVLAVVAAALLVVAGMLVEHWCALPPDDEEPESLEAQGLHRP